MKLLLALLLACLSAAPALNAATVRLGNEVLAADHFKALRGKRIGLLTNPSGVNHDLTSTVDLLRAAPGVQLVALFGPEHGVYGDVPAGESVESRTDARTGLLVHSLYGKTFKPTPEMLKGLDAMVYDLQDNGCRSYTFISSMGVAMEACAENGVEFIVLDRPNPLGGERIEGPMLDPKFRSAVGRWPIPYVYGLTCGELARMISGEGWIKAPCKLTVVPLKGWHRSMVWGDTGLPWVPTSPHIPHENSSLFYVATGILGELHGINTGVGYTLPFECIAGPDIDPHQLADCLNAYKLPGTRFKPLTYQPFYFNFTNRVIGGVQIFFTDPQKAPLTAINFYALEALKKVAKLDLLDETGNTRRRFSMFDKVSGTDACRKAVQAGTPVTEMVASWKPGEDAFRKARQKYLLY